MYKRLLNIALIFTLLVSVIGVSTTKVYCNALKITMEKSCCGDQDNNNGCCKDIKERISLSTDLSLENASVTIPDFTLFTITFLNTFYNSTIAFDSKHSYSTYNPPSITPDISILIQVFRI